MHYDLLAVYREALQVMNHAFSSKTTLYPLKQLRLVLLLDSDDDAAALCNMAHLQVRDGAVVFNKSCSIADTKVGFYLLRCLLD